LLEESKNGRDDFKILNLNKRQGKEMIKMEDPFATRAKESKGFSDPFQTQGASFKNPFEGAEEKPRSRDDPFAPNMSLKMGESSSK
jgi:hypothetical protein